MPNLIIVTPAPRPQYDDILVTGWLNEAQEFPQFRERQTVSVNSHYCLLGRRIRRAYVTPQALEHPRWPEFKQELDRVCRMSGGAEIRHIEDYWNDAEQDMASLVEEVQADRESVLVGPSV